MNRYVGTRRNSFSAAYRPAPMPSAVSWHTGHMGKTIRAQVRREKIAPVRSQACHGDLARGYFVEPTVFSQVSNDMTIAREEIFGPVVSVIPFDDAEHVLGLVNDTPYGLGGAVWTQNVTTAMKMAQGIKSGTVWVNCYGLIDASVGFGGYRMSGYGWKGGPAHVDGFLYQKAVYMNLG